MYGCSKDCLILVPFRLPQISCFTLSLKCFSSDSDNCPDMGIRPWLQFPHLPRTGPVLLTLLFFPIVPLSYWVLCSPIFSFPLVRYSCLLPAGFLHALLCLKVYSWCICGERCIPHPPTPPPSCSFHEKFFLVLHSHLKLQKLLPLGMIWASLRQRRHLVYTIRYFETERDHIHIIFFPFIISWRLITLQYWSGFCHTLTWISHGFTCIPHPDHLSHLPLHPIPLGLPNAPGPSTCLMHPAWAGDLFHPR